MSSQAGAVTIVVMHKRRVILPVVVLVLLLVIGIFFLFRTKVGWWLTGSSEVILSPLQGKTHQIVSDTGRLSVNSQIAKLSSENVDLTTKLARMQDLRRENKALQDQFRTQTVDSHSLIPATVIGARAFMPGISRPEDLTIDAGQNEGVKKGEAVIYKDNLVGYISSVFPHVSRVTLVTSSDSSLTVQTAKTHALGIARGEAGDGIVLDNVVLTDNLAKADIVETKGDVRAGTPGIPPHLVVGKIIAIHRKPSSLFQTADVESLLDLSRLDTVFVFAQ